MTCSPEELDRLASRPKKRPTSRGALGLVGAWGDATEEEIDAFVANIYAQRERDLPRPVELPE
jgi:hypothetical protein